jgi:hypothetical protein
MGALLTLRHAPTMKIIKHRWAVPVEVLLYPTLQMTPQQEKTSVKHFRQFQKLMKEQQVLIRKEESFKRRFKKINPSPCP